MITKERREVIRTIVNILSGMSLSFGREMSILNVNLVEDGVFSHLYVAINPVIKIKNSREIKMGIKLRPIGV